MLFQNMAIKYIIEIFPPLFCDVPIKSSTSRRCPMVTLPTSLGCGMRRNERGYIYVLPRMRHIDYMYVIIIAKSCLLCATTPLVCARTPS